MQGLDESVLRALYSAACTDVIVRAVMIALTCLGSGWTALALVAVLWTRSTRPLAAGLSVTLLAAATAVFTTKLAVSRLRPCVALRDVPALWGAPTDPSFPSGHATGAFAVAAFLTIALAGHSSRWTRSVWVAVWPLAVGIAASRVFLGVHYPSDVVGAAILGATIGILGGRIWRVRHHYAGFGGT